MWRARLAELADSPNRWWARVNARFALVLSLALLPLLVISLVQTRNLQDEAQGRAQQAMLGATLRATTGEIGVIRFAQGAVAALANSAAIVGTPASCRSAMRLTAAQVPAASLVAFVPKSGLMTCSSDGSSFDYSASSTSAQFQELISAKDPMFIVVRWAPVSGSSVLLVTHPVYNQDRNYIGYVSIALPHKKLDSVNKALDTSITGLELPAQFWTFNAAGEVLTANMGLDEVEQYLPSRHPLSSFVKRTATVFSDASSAGEERSYAMVPIIQGELYLMSSWDTRAGRMAARNDLSPYLLPILMWALGMIVAAWAAEWLVSRHVRVLTRAIGLFAKGDRSLDFVDLSEAPYELRKAGSAFASMADGVMRGEASLEDTIHQKDVLLREVHHRVKNNLQLIASIMNIQMRKAVAPESRALLKSLQERIMSLATIHRGLYQTSGMVDVRADELLRDIVRQIVNIGSSADRKFDVEVAVDELYLTPDQAVPLSLLLTEAMANAMKYAGTGPDGKIHIKVRLARTDSETGVIEVENSLASGVEARARSEAVDGTGLGDQLLTAFSQQLGGKLERTLSEDFYRLSVRFNIRNLTTAEDRDT
jgi:two-component system, sensor histidine kinase PdtaS